MVEDKKYTTVTHSFRVRTLSPLHIGAAEPLQKDFDYIHDGQSVYVIDFNHFINLLDVDLLRANDDADQYRRLMLQLFGQGKLKILREYAAPEECLSFYPFVRGGASAILPGSSIKGAVRTAVLAQFIRAKTALGRTAFIAPEEHLQKRMGKKEDNFKFSMDALRINDLGLNAESFALLSFKTFSLSEGDFKEKPDSRRTAESLAAGSSLKERLEFRLHYRQADLQLPGMNFLTDFCRTLGLHYGHQVRQELDFLKRFPGDSGRPIIAFYESLCKKLDGGAVLLQTGYGSGWSGKTGGVLEQNRLMWGRGILDYIRSVPNKNSHRFTKILEDNRYLQCPMGHSHMRVVDNSLSTVFCKRCRKEYAPDLLETIYPFPKSRTWAGRPLMPPGWLELIPDGRSVRVL